MDHLRIPADREYTRVLILDCLEDEM